MKKRRDPVAIGSVGSYTETENSELKTVQNNLINHVNEIRNSYQGKDAEAIIAKFLEIISKLDSVEQNLEYYGNYMKTVSEHDQDNLNTAKKDFGMVNNEPIATNPISETLPLETLGGEENGGI